MRKIAVLITAGVFALAYTGAALATPNGPEGPGNCTFDKGVTTCSYVGQPVATGTSTSAPDARTGCTTTTSTYTTTTTYTSHHGTYNSQGEEVTAPQPTSTTSTSSSTSCPPHGSVALNAGHSQGCSGAGQTGPLIGTVYYYESGPDVILHVELTNANPSSGYYFAQKCVAVLHTGVTSSSGADSFDVTLPGAAGATENFDYFDGTVYAMTNSVTL